MYSAASSRCCANTARSTSSYRLASTETRSPAVAVGDWLLIERDAPRVLRVLERRSLISRMAAGLEQRMQVMAANLDTLFVVTSCNEDSICRAWNGICTVARHAQVEPVIVLTKADLCADEESFAAQARSIARE